MRSILIAMLLMPALWGQKTEWTVRYVGGPYHAGENQRVPLEVLPDRVVLNHQISIPREAIMEVAYQKVSARRSGTWVSEDDFQKLDPRIYPLVGVVAFTNELFEIPRAYRHRIHLVWFESGRPNRLTMEASKSDYKMLLAAFVRVTGRPWKDFYTIPPERQAPRAAPLDAEAKAAVVRALQASFGRRAPVPAHLARPE